MKSIRLANAFSGWNELEVLRDEKTRVDCGAHGEGERP